MERLYLILDGTGQALAQAVLEQARQGDSSIVYVDTAH